MILIILAALCLITVPLTGGHLGRLGDLQIRWLWLAPLAIVVQVFITTIAPGGAYSLHVALHIFSYVLAGLFIWANRRIPGALIIGTGAGMNALVILLNHGVMPASPTAQRLAGLHLGSGFNNSAHVAHPVLWWLGDIIPFPVQPIGNVLSPGDIVLYFGMLVLLHRVCRRPAVAAAAGAAPDPPVEQLPAEPYTPEPAPAAPAPARTIARRGSRPGLAPLGVGLAGFLVALGIGSLVAARER
jgi:hypothetical protein